MAPWRSDLWLTSIGLVLAASIFTTLLCQVKPPAVPSDAGASPSSEPTESAPQTSTGPPSDSGSLPTARPSHNPPQGASAPQPGPSSRQLRAYVVAAIGDSLTDKKSHGGKYLDYVASRCPETRIDNYGRGADMVNQMRRRFLSDVLPSRVPYTHLIVFGGVNDLYSDQTAGRTPQKVARDLLDMYTKAHARGMEVIAITVAPWGGFTRYYNAKRGVDTRELNRWVRAQLDAGTVQHVVDANHLLACGDPERLCPDFSLDGIHFNAKGHEVLGRALYEHVFSDCK